LYSDALGDRAAAQMRTVSELRRAVREREFEMCVQPVIDLTTDRVIAGEMLIRWNHPDDGVRTPAGWIDVAERSGLMPEIGAWVLDESVRQAARWVDVVGVELSPLVHVNVSPTQLDTPGFADLVLATIDRHGLPAGKLVLELTETFLARVSGALVAEFEALAGHGVRIAADDFGTGYSPLTRLIELPVGMIKIDRDFVAAIPDDRRAHGIVTSLVHLALQLGLDLVAEGIETEAQLAALSELGCPAAQGYYWSPAVPAAEFESMVLAPIAMSLAHDR
jgi:EAL domain-containing protein (putative c-di-GMP-specific phosphodiesterase class I)